MIFKTFVLSPFKKYENTFVLSPFNKYDNGDLVSIGNIDKELRQDDFQNFCLVPIAQFRVATNSENGPNTNTEYIRF